MESAAGGGEGGFRASGTAGPGSTGRGGGAVPAPLVSSRSCPPLLSPVFVPPLGSPHKSLTPLESHRPCSSLDVSHSARVLALVSPHSCPRSSLPHSFSCLLFLHLPPPQSCPTCVTTLLVSPSSDPAYVSPLISSHTRAHGPPVVPTHVPPIMLSNLYPALVPTPACVLLVESYHSCSPFMSPPSPESPYCRPILISYSAHTPPFSSPYRVPPVVSLACVPPVISLPIHISNPLVSPRSCPSGMTPTHAPSVTLLPFHRAPALPLQPAAG